MSQTRTEPKKVYALVAERGDYSDYRKEVCRVYSSRAKAEAEAARYTENYRERLDAYEALNAYRDEQMKGAPVWTRENAVRVAEFVDSANRATEAYALERYGHVGPNPKNWYAWSSTSEYSVEEIDFVDGDA